MPIPRNKFIRILSTGTALALAMCLTFPVSASALDLSGYFSLSINSTLGQASVYPGGSLSPTITGMATCETDLPFAVSGATITGQIVAVGRNNETFLLNPAYTVTLRSFPIKKGQSVQDTQTIYLSFPGNMPPGQYDVVGQVTDARIQIVIWFDVTQYVTATMGLGTVTVFPPGPGTVLTQTPTPVVTSASALPPAPVTTPAPTSASTIISVTGSAIAPGQKPAPSSTQTVQATSASTSTPGATSIKLAIPPVPTTASPTGSEVSFDNSGTIPWTIFPLSVGAMTLLLVILAVARSLGGRPKKGDYTFRQPPE
jgi:hypothetical protein